MVEVIAEKDRIAAARGRFDRIRQVAPLCTPSNACFLGPTRVHIPTASPSIQRFLQGSRW